MDCQCENCGAHFIVTKSGQIQAGGCPSCGGDNIRPYRDQPRPTNSDMAFRNLVDSDSQRDMGGNPLGEGTITTGRVASQVCPYCEQLTDENYCPNCKEFISIEGVPSNAKKGLPSLLQQEIAGNSLSEGFMSDGGESEKPIWKRDNFMHSSVDDIPAILAAQLFDQENEPDPNKSWRYPDELTENETAWAQGQPHGYPPYITESDQWESVCPECKGEGEIGGQECPTCGGRGDIYHENPIDSEPDEGYMTPHQMPEESVIAPGFSTKPLEQFERQLGQGQVQKAFGRVESAAERDPSKYNKITYENLLQQPNADPPIVALTDPDMSQSHWITPCPTCRNGVDRNSGHAYSTGFLENGQQCPNCGGKGEFVNQQAQPRGEGVVTPHDISPSESDLAAYDEAKEPEMVQLEEKLQNVQPKFGAWASDADFHPHPEEKLYSYSRHLSLEPYLPWGYHSSSFMAPVMMGLGAIKLGKMAGGLMKKAIGGGPEQGGPTQIPGGADNQALAKVAYPEYETPHSNPDVGVKQDDPEKVDQHEFNDGDKSPKNILNPNLQDFGNSWEDEAKDEGGFGPNSPGLQRLEMALPIVVHYYHSPESGLKDPMIKSIHEILEDENPGYLDSITPEMEQLAEQFAKTFHQQHQSSNMPYGEQPPNMFQNVDRNQPGQQYDEMTKQQSPPGMQPGEGQLPKCPDCGGPIGMNGNCAKCGTSNIAQPGVHGEQQSVAAPGMALPAQMNNPAAGASGYFPPYKSSLDIVAALVESADHQGPVTEEQFKAVEALLEIKGMRDQIAELRKNPAAFDWALAELQPNVETMPKITPEEQAQPAPPPAQPGAQPQPGMGNPGGQPMAPVAALIAEASDNVARECPNCGSHTTGVMHGDGTCWCHSCQKTFKDPGLQTDGDPDNTGVTAKTALTDMPNTEQQQQQDPMNPVNAPAAEREKPYDPEADRDPTMTWKDSEGQKLIPGHEYEMHNPKYTLPDVVRVDQVKPDGIDVTAVGVFQNEPNAMEAPIEVSRQQMEMDKIEFTPLQSSENEEAPAGTPGEERVPPSGPTTDEHDDSFPSLQPKSNVCPNCKRREFTSSMIDPDTMENDCYYCLHKWKVASRYEGAPSEFDLSYLFDSDPIDDYGSERQAAMRESEQKSRDIKSIAEKDNRLQILKEKLRENAQEREARLAGKKFSPAEQKELIDERGEARNRDRLDLTGTHYEARNDWTGKANAGNVPDEHMELLLGL